MECEDLTVDDGVLYLKVPTGVQRVDVLLTDTNGQLIGPFKQDQASLLSSPGMIDAIRHDKVRISNSGFGILDAPALAAFLPALWQRLLGEAPLLESAPAYWLGDPAARERLAAEPGPWRIAPATKGNGAPFLLDALAPNARANLMAQIKARPWAWCATSSLLPSLAPWLGGEGLRPRPIVLRQFLVNDGAAWQVMSGGVAWLFDPKSMPHSAEARGACKDVWVMADHG